MGDKYGIGDALKGERALFVIIANELAELNKNIQNLDNSVQRLK